MSLQQWYDSLFVRVFPPAREFVKGVATGAGIPTSLEEARKSAATALGFAFGVPAAHDAVAQSMQQTGEALTHPLETGRALVGAAQRNPAAAAGVLTGMALPWGHRIPAAERLPKVRVGGMGWDMAQELMRSVPPQIQAKISQLKPGQTFRWRGHTWQIEEGGTIGRVALSPDDASAVKYGGDVLRSTTRQMDARVARERARVHAELEGPTGPLPDVRTREDIGGEMLERLDLQPQTQISGYSPVAFANELAKFEQRGDLPPILPGEKVAVMGQRWQKGTKGWQRLDGKPVAGDYDWIFRKFFDRTPPPQYFGGEFVPEGGGLMEHLGLPEPNPIREANIERAVEEVAGAGNLTFAKARTVVAKRIRDRQKQGLATPQESVWLNVHRMGGFQGGKFRWHQ